MPEDGQPDPLNEQAKPPRRWIAQALSVGVVITIGIVSGAKIWQPVKKVEQKVAPTIREAVKRRSPMEDLPAMVAEVCPAVISLHFGGTTTTELPAQGILLTGEGMAATTAKIPDNAAIEAWLNDGQRLKATVAGADAPSGVTILKLEGSDLPTASFGDTDLPKLGSWGFTLVSPLGRGCQVESGLVSSDFLTDGSTKDYYIRAHAGQAAPPPGTPFLSGDGRIAGLARAVEGKNAPTDHFVPIDLVTTVASYLMQGLSAAANGFGLIVEDLSPALADRLGADRGRGAVVVVVAKGSIADKAGLQIGDVILSAGQSPISSASEFNRQLKPDKPIDLVFQRGPDQTTQTVSLKPATVD